MCLTVNPGQRVELTTASGEKIVVHLNRVGPNSARLAFEAEKSVRIIRGTVLDKQEKVP